MRLRELHDYLSRVLLLRELDLVASNRRGLIRPPPERDRSVFVRERVHRRARIEEIQVEGLLRSSARLDRVVTHAGTSLGTSTSASDAEPNVDELQEIERSSDASRTNSRNEICVFVFENAVPIGAPKESVSVPSPLLIAAVTRA